MKKQFSNRLEENLLKTLNELAEETRIPMSRLLDEAVRDLLKKHGKEVIKN